MILVGKHAGLTEGDGVASRIERLERLDELRLTGAITDAEFDAQKAKLLGTSTRAHVEQAESSSSDRANAPERYRTSAEESGHTFDQRALSSPKKPLVIAGLFLAVLASGYALTRHAPTFGLRSGQAATALSTSIPEIGSQPVAFVEGDPNSTAATVVSALFSQGAKCFASTSLGVTTNLYEIDASAGTVLAQANGLWPERLFDFKLVADHLELKPRAKYESDVDLVQFKSVRRDGESYKISGSIGDAAVSNTVFDCRA